MGGSKNQKSKRPLEASLGSLDPILKSGWWHDLISASGLLHSVENGLNRKRPG